MRAEQRQLPRKRVVLGGVIADPNGENAVDCTIRDINERGAQVESPKKSQQGDEVFLLNTRTEAAHLATVAWIKDDLTGLSFIRSYSLEAALPSELKFVVRLFIEAKFRRVKALTERGILVGDALRAVDFTENHLKRFVVRAGTDEKVELLIRQAQQLFNKH
jgi:hypothetical protein